MVGKENLNVGDYSAHTESRGLEVWELNRRNWVASEQRGEQGTKGVSSDRGKHEQCGSMVLNIRVRTE
jgi:hypothetical protein